MSSYRTCFGCQLRGKPCPTRAVIADAIKGLGIQSLRHKCAGRRPLFAIGQPVWLETVYAVDGDGDENGTFRDSFAGHVVKDLGSKALVFVPPGTLGRDDPHEDYAFASKTGGFCKVSLKKLTAREGDVEAICDGCMAPSSFGHTEDCGVVFMQKLTAESAGTSRPA